MKGIENIMRRAPVIPVLVIEDAADAGPMARALVADGLPVIEVILQTPAALDAVQCVGGSWLIGKGEIDIAVTARRAASLVL